MLNEQQLLQMALECFITSDNIEVLHSADRMVILHVMNNNPEVNHEKCAVLCGEVISSYVFEHMVRKGWAEFDFENDVYTVSYEGNRLLKSLAKKREKLNEYDLKG